MTHVLLVGQEKGGVGKTLISRGLAEVVPGAPLFEIDSSPRMIELCKRVRFFQMRADRDAIERTGGAASCVFPDHPRIRAPEHFINLPRDSKGLTSDECPQADKCVLTAILNDSKVLSSKAEKDADRLIALKSLGHWVGDIHQPLHVSFGDDRGGNNIRVSGQCAGNLHATWDNCLVLYAVGPDISEAATDLIDGITPEMKTRWDSSTPRDWANESFSLSEAAKTGYCVVHGSSCDLAVGGVSISAEYFDANEPVVKEQLQKAGVRLARILDTAFGN